MFFKFQQGDIVTTNIRTFPSYLIKSGSYGLVSGTIYLFNSSSVGQHWEGISQKENLPMAKNLPTASLSIYNVERSITGSKFQTFASVNNLFTFYNKFYPNIFTASFSGTTYDKYVVIDIPEIFYWNKIHSGSLRLIDYSGSGPTLRTIFDNGLGGLLKSGSNDVFVGNIFYSEGIIVLKDPDLWNWGTVASGEEKFSIGFSGTNTIPVNIYRCLMPPGELNFSNNSSFMVSGSDEYKGGMISHFSGSPIMITGIGLYNKKRELLGIAKFAQPIEKTLERSIIIKLRQDR